MHLCITTRILNKMGHTLVITLPLTSFGINSVRPRQNGRHVPDDIFKYILLNEKVWISIKISLKSVPKGPVNNIPALVQILAWRRPRDKPLSEPMMVRFPTHKCVARPQWFKQGYHEGRTYCSKKDRLCIAYAGELWVICHPGPLLLTLFY